jgi:hypothetical protein
VSSEKPVKSWDDVRHAFDDLLQRPFHRFTWHRDILPRYLDGRLSLHLHIALDGGITACCEIASRNRYRILSDLERAEWPRTEFNCDAFNYANGEQKHTMFILVHELGKPPERLIPSIVRLNSLNLVDRTCGKLTILQSMRTFLDFTRIVGNKERGEFSVSELVNIQRWLEVFCGEFPHDIIESRPSVSDDVADDCTQRQFGLRRDDGRKTVHGIHPRVLRLSAGLAPDLVDVSAQVTPDFHLQGIEVLLSPDDFEPCAI